MFEVTNHTVETSIALLVLRFTTGMLFFFQGYDKLFRLGTSKVLDTVSDPLKKTLIPIQALRPMVLLSSWIELSGGLLLMLGVFRTYALVALSADLVMVAFVFTSIKAMWDMQFFFPRFLMVIALLLLPSQADIYTIEELIK